MAPSSRAALSRVIPLLSCCYCLGAAGAAGRCRCVAHSSAEGAPGARVHRTGLLAKPGARVRIGSRGDAAFCAPGGLGLHAVLAMCGPRCEDASHLAWPLSPRLLALSTRAPPPPDAVRPDGAAFRGQFAPLSRSGVRAVSLSLKGGRPSSSHLFSRDEGHGRGMTREQVRKPV